MADDTLAKIVENFERLESGKAYVNRCGYRIRRWSYREVAEGAYRIALELRQQGIVPGNSVLLWGSDCAEWVAAFLGCVLSAAVVVPMDRSAPVEFVSRVCRQVNVRFCICSQTQPEIDPSIRRFNFERLGESTWPISPHSRDLPPLDREDIVEIVFTSGTTADPKGIVLTHRNILANLDPLESEIKKYLKYERIVHPLRFLNLLPLSHVFGQYLGLFVPQLLGGTVVCQDTLSPSEIIRTIKREGVSVLVAVPRIMESLRDKIERDLEQQGRLQQFRRDFGIAVGEHFIKRWWRFRRLHYQFGWRFWAFISGGATLDAATEQFWSRLGFAVIQGYGLTETTSLVSVNHPFGPGKGSIGRVLPGRELKLAPDGEILVRGESIAKGYYQGSEVKPVVGDDEWFHTGDLGTVDEQGFLYFKGRRKNVIVSPEGMNIYPEDLEAALRRQTEIRDCAVVGLRRGGNEEACAVLMLHDREQDPDLAIKRANRSLAEHQQIRRWLVWPDEDFPRTATQKPQMSTIQEFAESYFRGTAGSSVGIGTVAGLIARITGRRIDHVSPQSNLSTDLSLSSIERVELLSALEDRFQVNLDESRFTSAMTIGDLEEMLNRPGPQGANYHYPRWAQSSPVAVLRFLVYHLLSWPATLLLARPRIRGRENLRNLRGPLLLVSNHVTRVDVGLILAALPLRFRYRLAVAMMGEMLQAMREPPRSLPFFRRIWERILYGLAMALFNVFPLPQKTGFRRSFAFAGESVDRGHSLLIFPEGERTSDGQTHRFRAGVGLLAANLDLPVVPMRIDGLFGRRVIGRGKIRISIGHPMRFSSRTDPLEIALQLQESVRALEFSSLKK
jgi:long-chain acyl-CoA synthetase